MNRSLGNLLWFVAIGNEHTLAFADEPHTTASHLNAVTLRATELNAGAVLVSAGNMLVNKVKKVHFSVPRTRQ
jgi:hypothetical protein